MVKEQSQPAPLYENSDLAEIAETDERLSFLLHRLRVASEEHVRSYPDDKASANLPALTEEVVRGYLEDAGYAWEEEFPEPPEEPGP